MAEERLTVLMRARGAVRAAKETRRFGKEVDDVGDKSVRTNKRVGFLSRGLRLLQTRFGMLIIVASLAAVVLGPPLLGAVVLLTAAAVALGGALIPLVALGMAVAGRFSAMQGFAGSAAAELMEAADNFKFFWQQATAPGADILMRSLTRVLAILTPLIKEMQGPLTTVATAAGQALVAAATGFAALGPDLTRMLEASAPLIAQMGDFLPALTSALIHLAIAGMPVLQQLLEWLTDFSYWLGPAIDDADRFAHSASFLAVVSQAGQIAGDVFEYLGGVVADLAVIAYGTFTSMAPLLALLGGSGLGIAQGFAAVLDFVAQHIDVFGPIIAGVLTFALAVKVATIAIALFNTVMALNPVVLIIAAVIGLAVALYLLYHRFQSVRTVLDILWTILMHTPLAYAIRGFIMLGKAVVTHVKPVIQWLIDKIKWLIDAGGKVGSIIGDVGGAVGGAIGKIPGLAEGGPVHRGGAYVVGESGPELFTPDRAGQIVPNGVVAAGDTNITVPLYLDGWKVAESTARVTRKKRSTS